jgi:hypothetical protein
LIASINDSQVWKGKGQAKVTRRITELKLIPPDNSQTVSDDFIGSDCATPSNASSTSPKKVDLSEKIKGLIKDDQKDPTNPKDQVNPKDQKDPKDQANPKDAGKNDDALDLDI